jgi:hypothetical protein
MAGVLSFHIPLGFPKPIPLSMAPLAASHICGSFGSNCREAGDLFSPHLENSYKSLVKFCVEWGLTNS